jgi:predicted permease
LLAQLAYVLGIVLPLYMVIAVGAGAGRIGLIDQRLRQGISKIVFYVAIPPLLFQKVAQCDFMTAFDPPALLATMGLLLAVCAAIYLACTARRLGSENVGVFTQGAYRSNMVFFGLPVLAMAFGEPIIAPAAIFVAILMPVYNVLGVMVLVLPHQGNGRRLEAAALAREIAANPIILSCAAGFVFSWLSIPIPAPVGVALDLVGRVAFPLALIELGSGIRFDHLRGIVGLAGANAAVKLGLMPLLALWLLRAIGTDGPYLTIPVVLMACPTAMVSYIMARQMKGNPALAAQQVVFSTLLSILTIPLWLMVLGVGR